MAAKSAGVFGLPEKWKFDYPWPVVKLAFWLWSASDFQRLPPLEEVLSHDPRYISDMHLAYHMYSFFKNDHPIFKIAENLENQFGGGNGNNVGEESTYGG